jgi:hypothetical protein
MLGRKWVGSVRKVKQSLVCKTSISEEYYLLRYIVRQNFSDILRNIFLVSLGLMSKPSKRLARSRQQAALITSSLAFCLNIYIIFYFSLVLKDPKERIEVKYGNNWGQAVA